MLHNRDLSCPHQQDEIKGCFLERHCRGETDDITGAWREPCLQRINHGKPLQTLAPVGVLIPQRDLDLLITLTRLQEQTYVSYKRFATAAVHGNVPDGKGPQAAGQG